MRFSIDQKIDLIDQKYIQMIQQRSSIDRTRQIQNKILIAISISRETGSIDRKFGKIKFWKNQIFEKQSNFMQKLLKA